MKLYSIIQLFKTFNKTVVTILGDSILKEVKGYELTDCDCWVIIVKSFSSATTGCMEHNIKPTLDHKPDQIILHCGTNELRKTESSKEVVENISNLAVEISKHVTVCVLGLLARDDRFSYRVNDVNNHLKSLCTSRNIRYIDNGNIESKHLNCSKLHPNTKVRNCWVKTLS